MIILDTNVLSALMRQVPDGKVVAWLDKQPRTSVWTTSVTVLEIQFGLRIMVSGKRQSLLVQGFDALLETIDRRVVPFDDAAAREAANLMAIRHSRGKPGDLRDTMIAGIALAHHAALATGNTAHFSDLSVQVINPWTE